MSGDGSASQTDGKPAPAFSGITLDNKIITLDQFRGKLAHDLRARIGSADDDRELSEALDRWELSLFAEDIAEEWSALDAQDQLDTVLKAIDASWPK